ncbi:MAG: GHKL domain-containing protein [Magnetococcales bacterium]|nr:GHKL domain-containing protein [Magnetococcales bacterium]
MAGVFCVFCCETFLLELTAATRSEGWDDVIVVSYPVRCGRPPVTWSELESLLPDHCSGVATFGRTCLKGLGEPPKHWPQTFVLPQRDCFHLVADINLVSEAITRGAYLMTPGWLQNWPQRLKIMGFSHDQAKEFFNECARELLLLDTDTHPEARIWLQELASVVHLPATRMRVGLDHARLNLFRLVSKWRLEGERKANHRKISDLVQEKADLIGSLDFLGRLALLQEEAEAITAMDEMFRMLFAPQILHVAHKVNGVLKGGNDLPQPLMHAMANLTEEWSWTPSGTGFILRLGPATGKEYLLVVDDLAFPNFRERYLGLALNLANICGLVLQNSQTLRQIRKTEATLLEVNQELKEFAYVASHDLQEPLRTINTYATFLLEDMGEQNLNDVVKEDLRFITEAVGRMKTLIQALLNFSRSGRLEVKNHPVALQGCLEAVLDNLRASLEERGAQVCLSNLPTVRGDATALISVFQNLLGNALKFCRPEVTPEIRVDTECSGEAWMIHVSDNGIGMEEKYLEQIFQPFKRLHGKKEYPGTGLGLSIVKKIVEQHGGSIRVSSIPGQGSIFTLTLPAWSEPSPTTSPEGDESGFHPTSPGHPDPLS